MIVQLTALEAVTSTNAPSGNVVTDAGIGG